MYSLSLTKAVFLFFIAFLCVPEYSIADETFSVGTITTTPAFRFNNENWFTEEHPKVATFTMMDDGSAYGLTETGVPFTQYNIPNELGIRIQRFEIQDHHHYIVEGEIVENISELSKRLAFTSSESTG